MTLGIWHRSDAVEFAGGLTERYGGQNDGRRLASHTQVRLPRVWRYQEFSNLMLSLFNAGAAGDDSGSSPMGYAALASA